MTFAEAVYWLVARIPPGRVMSYGHVATALGYPRAARAVGGALRFCEPDLPWWRVVNRAGQVTTPVSTGAFNRQIANLRREGVDVDDSGSIFLLPYEWWPDDDLEAEIALLTNPSRVLDQGL